MMVKLAVHGLRSADKYHRDCEKPTLIPSLQKFDSCGGFPNWHLSDSTWRTAFGRFAMSAPVPLRTDFDAASMGKARGATHCAHDQRTSSAYVLSDRGKRRRCRPSLL